MLVEVRRKCLKLSSMNRLAKVNKMLHNLRTRDEAFFCHMAHHKNGAGQLFCLFSDQGH